MTKALLIVPPFWDPVCVPLGVSSLKAYSEPHGHNVSIVDLNTDPAIFSLQHLYFQEVKRQFPRWKNWNIERNGTEMLAMHQIVYLRARQMPGYRALVGELLNVHGGPLSTVIDQVDVRPFDQLFARLYAAVREAVTRRLAEIRPEVVGCSLFNSTWPATLFILELAKKISPEVRTVIGGPGPIMGSTAEPTEVRQFYEAHDAVDFFVVGEGEQPFLDILENPTQPPGILSARQFSERPLDLNSLPTPDYGGLAVDRYLQLSVASSRGCPFECSFCAETVFWNGFRKTRNNGTYERMKALAERYQRQSFYLCDSLSNAVIGPITAEIRRNKSPYALDCYLRADKSCVDPKAAADWRSGGLFRARLGMESASQRILEEMVKMTTPDLMSRSLKALASNGIMTSTLWVIGYPGETESEFQQTLSFIEEYRSEICHADAWLFQFHRSGLANSHGLEGQHGSRLRFSDDLTAILRVQPYVVDKDIDAAERIDRLERFVMTMRRLEIPNPYNLFEWVAAERRWRELGRDAGWGLERSMVALNG